MLDFDICVCFSSSRGVATRAYKYSKLQKLVGHVSTGLFKRGFRKGDVFAIMAPNVREFPIIFYAVI